RRGKLLRERRLPGIEALDLCPELGCPGGRALCASPDVREGGGQPDHLRLVPGQGPAKRFALRPARRGRLGQLAPLRLAISPGLLGPAERSLSLLELPLPFGEGRSDLLNGALRPLQLLLQGEQAARAPRGLGEPLGGPRLLA